MTSFLAVAFRAHDMLDLALTCVMLGSVALVLIMIVAYEHQDE